MSTELEISCACGEVRGLLKAARPGEGNRCVCYCSDCQQFARELASAERVLDAHGGTDIYQAAPSRVVLVSGREHIACLRLTAHGPLRWYAACCNTPLVNTPPTPDLPFVSLLVASLRHDADDETIDEALGPVRYRIFASDAVGDRAALEQASDGLPLPLLINAIGQIFLFRVRGERRRSAFFDGCSLAPIASPRPVQERPTGAG